MTSRRVVRWKAGHAGVAAIQKQVQPTNPIKFETGNGAYVSDSCISVTGSQLAMQTFR